MTVYDTPGQVRLEVRIESGEVRIEAVDTAETSIDVDPMRDDSVTRQAIAEMTVDHHELGGRHEVIVKLPTRRRLFGRGAKVRVRARVPSGADVVVATAAGDVVSTGRLGAVEVKSASGDIAVEEIGSTGRISAVAGDVRIERALGELSVTAVSGDADVGLAQGPLSLKSVSGDQRVAALEAGPVRLQSVSGDVRVGVSPGLALWIDANSVSGRMVSELDVDGEEPETAQPMIELRARTVSGDVRIERAETASPAS